MADAAVQSESFTHEASDGVKLHVHAFAPAQDSGAPVVVMLHGIASHAGWYRSLGHDLAAAGIAAFLTDRRGSGLSEGTRGHANSWRRLVRDVVEISGEARRRVPGRAQHLLGVSLGAVISLATCLSVPSLFASQVLLAPGLASARRISLRERVDLLRRGLMTPEHLYELPFTVDQLTDDPDARERYLTDELRTRKVTARLLIELFRMQRHVVAKLPLLEVPAYTLLAGNDTVVDNRVAEAALVRARRTTMRIELFAGAAHNLMLSLPRDLLLERLTRWILDERERGARTVLRIATDTGEGSRL